MARPERNGHDLQTSPGGESVVFQTMCCGLCAQLRSQTSCEDASVLLNTTDSDVQLAEEGRLTLQDLSDLTPHVSYARDLPSEVTYSRDLLYGDGWLGY